MKHQNACSKERVKTGRGLDVMKEMKVSAVIGVSVTVLAVVTAFAFSFATIAYQAEVNKLRRANIEYKKTLESYKVALEAIQTQLAQLGFQITT